MVLSAVGTLLVIFDLVSVVAINKGIHSIYDGITHTRGSWIDTLLLAHMKVWRLYSSWTSESGVLFTFIERQDVMDVRNNFIWAQSRSCPQRHVWMRHIMDDSRRVGMLKGPGHTGSISQLFYPKNSLCIYSVSALFYLVLKNAVRFHFSNTMKKRRLFGDKKNS